MPLLALRNAKVAKKLGKDAFCIHLLCFFSFPHTLPFDGCVAPSLLGRRGGEWRADGGKAEPQRR